MKAELDGLAARKTAFQAELRKVQREEKEYDDVLKNINMLLSEKTRGIEKNNLEL